MVYIFPPNDKSLPLFFPEKVNVYYTIIILGSEVSSVGPHSKIYNMCQYENNKLIFMVSQGWLR